MFPIYAKNHRVLVIWDLNGYGEYEFDRCICEKISPKFSNFWDIIRVDTVFMGSIGLPKTYYFLFIYVCIYLQ